MSAEQLNQLWTIARENERNIAVLTAKFGATEAEVQKLKKSNDEMKSILDRALGAKTMAGIIGGIVGTLFGALVAYYCARMGAAK